MNARYEKLGKIGDGAFGEVFKVFDTEERKIFAMKLMSIGTNDYIAELPFQELRSMKELDHENVIRFHDVISHSSQMGIIMEYAPFDLSEVLRRTTYILSTKEIKSVMHMLLHGVCYCHKHHIMHRDLKPSNLLLSERGVLKIGDFGQATVYAGKSHSYAHQVATRWYRAPELLFGSKTYDPAVDMWAIGAIFAELLRNAPLFIGLNDIDQVYKVAQILGSPSAQWPGVETLPDYSKISLPDLPPLALCDVFTGISEDAIDLISKLLVYDPTKRITAKEALKHPYFFTAPLPSAHVQDLVTELELRKRQNSSRKSKAFVRERMRSPPSSLFRL